jgi:hypothetical protein
MFNSIKNFFTELSTDQTRWTSELDYTIKKGFMLKVMSKLAPGMFKKQSQKWMDQFEEWSEGLRKTLKETTI